MDYILYKCRRCSKEFILLHEDVNNVFRDGHYLSCCYCGSKKVVIENKYDSIKECMEARVYKRVNGKMREVR